MVTAVVREGLPLSIELYESEDPFTDPDLDWGYIDQAARQAASILDSTAAGVVAEVNYQPGDGTRYALVIVPVLAMEPVSGRVVDGQSWSPWAVEGVDRDEHAFLVCHVDGMSYPVRLGRRERDLAASYIGEHWKLPATSAVSVAVFLRAVSWHLNQLEGR